MFLDGLGSASRCWNVGSAPQRYAPLLLALEFLGAQKDFSFLRKNFKILQTLSSNKSEPAAKIISRSVATDVHSGYFPFFGCTKSKLIFGAKYI